VDDGVDDDVDDFDAEYAMSSNLKKII